MKKSIKKAISGVLCGAIVCGGAIGVIAGANSGNGSTDSYVPIFRMAVASDTHVDMNNAYRANRIKSMFSTAYAYADAHESYNKLDAVVVTGDLIDYSYYGNIVKFKSAVDASIRTETTFIGMLGNHDIYKHTDLNKVDYSTYRDENDGYTEYRSADGWGWYQDAMDGRVDHSVTINGIQLISMSTPDREGEYGDLYDGSTTSNSSADDGDKIEWLEGELKKAAENSPKMPIFTFQHHHIRNTVLGSYYWTEDGGETYLGNSFHSAENSAQLTEAFSKYPQVINFSGHTHVPNGNVRNVHQENFTSVSVSAFKDITPSPIIRDPYLRLAHSAPDTLTNLTSTSYQGVTTDGASLEGKVLSTKEKDYSDSYILVEVDANGLVKLRTYDLSSNAFMLTPTTGDGDAVLEFDVQIGETAAETKANFQYTNARADVATAPTWGTGTSLTFGYVADTTVNVKFPNALDEQGMWGYLLTVKDADGNVVKAQYAYDYDYYMYGYDLKADGSYKDEEYTISGLTADTTYTVEVNAVNIWGKTSSALSGVISTTATA